MGVPPPPGYFARWSDRKSCELAAASRRPFWHFPVERRMPSFVQQTLCVSPRRIPSSCGFLSVCPLPVCHRALLWLDASRYVLPERLTQVSCCRQVRTMVFCSVQRRSVAVVSPRELAARDFRGLFFAKLSQEKEVFVTAILAEPFLVELSLQREVFVTAILGGTHLRDFGGGDSAKGGLRDRKFCRTFPGAFSASLA